tara:strand:+ start:66 stop:290 length:225 start_codon:yes stop_codon:yes gene_type:complete
MNNNWTNMKIRNTDSILDIKFTINPALIRKPSRRRKLIITGNPGGSQTNTNLFVKDIASDSMTYSLLSELLMMK